MASDILDRVAMVITDTGSGALAAVTANVLISDRFNTPQEAGAVDGKSYWWMLEEGVNYEIFEGVWTLSGTKVARTTVWQSKIDGAHGTTKMTLGGNATLRSVTPAEAFDVLLRVDKAQAFSAAQKLLARANLAVPARDISLVGGDANTLSETGTYYLDSSSSNIPSSSSYWIVENFYFSVNNAFGIQIATSLNLSTVQRWMRVKQSGAWSGWLRFAVATDLPAAASDTVPGLMQIATTTEMKVASNALKAVTPSRLKWHPGVLKVGGLFDRFAGAGWTWGVSSSSKPGTGYIDVVFSSNFTAGVNSALVLSGYGDSTNIAFNLGNNGANTCRCHCITPTTGTLTDPNYYTLLGAGDIAT